MGGCGARYLCAAAAGLLLAARADGSAITFTAPGHLGFVLENEADPADQRRLYVGNLHRDEPIELSFTIDAMAGTLDVTGAGAAGLYAPDAHTTGSAPLPGSSLDAAFTVNYTGVDFVTDPVTNQSVLAIGRAGSSATGTLTLEGPIAGGLVTLELFDVSRFAAGPNANHRIWGPFGAQPFTIFAGTVPGDWLFDHQQAVAGWLGATSSLMLGGSTFTVLGGDVQGQIPEPATAAMTLVLAALFPPRRRR